MSLRSTGPAFCGLALAALLGCGDMGVLESSSEDYELDVPSDPRVEARIDDGRIEVEGAGAGRVRVTVRKRARGLDREAARAMLESLEVRVEEMERGVRVESRFGGTSALGGDVRVELVLRVPERSELDLRTGDGRIEVRAVEGRISTETGDGSIELDGLTGSIRARTADGSIRGAELSGSLDARTGDGRIELDGRFDALEATTGDGSIRVTAQEPAPRALSAPWTLRTADGSIRLRLPRTLSAEIDASTLDGSLSIDLSGFSGERRERRLRGALGDGGAVILLTTMDGSIHVEQR